MRWRTLVVADGISAGTSGIADHQAPGTAGSDLVVAGVERKIDEVIFVPGDVWELELEVAVEVRIEHLAPRPSLRADNGEADVAAKLDRHGGFVGDAPYHGKDTGVALAIHCR